MHTLIVGRKFSESLQIIHGTYPLEAIASVLFMYADAASYTGPSIAIAICDTNAL